jgi:hypothetical protein
VPIARGRHIAAQDIRHACGPRPPDCSRRDGRWTADTLQGYIPQRPN